MPAEPLVQDPIAVDWDADGRLWVVEYPEYVRNLTDPEPNLEPIGRIGVLEDTDNDGTMDKRTVFADGLVQGRSVKALDHGILVHEPPDIWLMKDTNGDLRMDTKEKVGTDHGRREGSVEGNANTLRWGLDNYLHSAGSSVSSQLRLKDGTWGVAPTLSRGEWGVGQDDFGRMFRNSSEATLQVDLVPTPYLARNPTQIRTRGSYEVLTNDVNNINEVWPVRPNPGTNRSYQYGILRPSDGTIIQVTAACGPEVYSGDRLPAELYGNVFVAEPTANFVRRIVITDDGTTLRARSAYDKAEFLGSTDERFRPVAFSTAPDGTLMIVDFYRGVIQDRSSTTVYLKDYIQKRNLDNPMGVGMGRIWRVMHTTTERDTTRPQLSRATPPQLVRDAVASERLVARYRPAPARRTRLHDRHDAVEGARDRQRAAAREGEGAVGARRQRRHRRRDADHGARRSVAGRAHERGAYRGTMAGRRQPPDSRRGPRAHRRSRLERAAAARRVARCDGRRAEGNGAGVAPAETRQRSGRDGRRGERHARHRNGGAREPASDERVAIVRTPKPRSR